MRFEASNFEWLIVGEVEHGGGKAQWAFRNRLLRGLVGYTNNDKNNNTRHAIMLVGFQLTI
jgi:hypothetical protein